MHQPLDYTPKEAPGGLREGDTDPEGCGSSSLEYQPAARVGWVDMRESLGPLLGGPKPQVSSAESIHPVAT